MLPPHPCVLQHCFGTLSLLAAALSLGRKGCWQLSPRAFPPRVPLQVRPQAAPESPMARLAPQSTLLGHRAFLLLPRGPEAHWPCVLWMKPPFAVISPRAGPSTQVQEIEGCEMRKRLVGLPCSQAWSFPGHCVRAHPPPTTGSPASVRARTEPPLTQAQPGGFPLQPVSSPALCCRLVVRFM